MIETALIVPAGIVGILFAGYLFQQVAAVNLGGSDDERSSLRGEDGEKLKNLEVIYNYIREGAKAFLFAEYKICAIFIVLFGLLVLILTAHPWKDGDWKSGALLFLLGMFSADRSHAFPLRVLRRPASADLPAGSLRS